MKSTIIIAVLLCFAVSKATFAHVSHKQVKEAKCKYLNDQRHYGRAGYYKSADVIECERLTYEGFKAIRHDQKFWVRKK